MIIWHFTSKGQTNLVNILNPNIAPYGCFRFDMLKQDAVFL